MQTTETRVAYLLKTFPRLSETFILNEMRGLVRLGVRLEIFSLHRPTETKTHPAVAELGCPVTYVPSLAPAWRPHDIRLLLLAHLAQIIYEPVRYVRAIRFFLVRQRGARRLKDFLQAGALAASLRRRKITHLHAHFANVPTTVAELASQFSGVTYSFTAHAKDIYLSRHADLRRKIAGAQFVLTCTAFNQQYLKCLANPGDENNTPIHLCYHGIDLEQFLATSLSPSADPPLILSVGRFCEKKGFPYLIEACKRLKDCGHNFRCRIVGYGELKDALAALIVRSGLDDCVSLAGPMTQQELVEEYRQASIFVLPCLVTDNGDRDGIPNVLLEAMSMGVPVISTDVSGISEVVEHMETGLLVAEKDSEAVAGALLLLLKQPQLRRRLAENARRQVHKTFSLDSSGRRVLEAFHSLDSGESKTTESTVTAGARI